MKDFFTHWKTNLIAIVIIGGLGYKAFTSGFNIADAINGFIAIGFLFAKDFNKSNPLK